MYESGEMYLETILLLQQKNGSVRSIDVAREMNFSKPSVSRGMGILKNEKYIVVDANGHITLTKKGIKKAESIFERHQILTAFLVETANVSKEIAEEDACKMEHILSEETFIGIKKYMSIKK